MSRLERWSRIKRGLEPDNPPSDSKPDTPVHHEPQSSLDAADPHSLDESVETPTVDGNDDSEEQTSTATPPPPGSLDETLPDPETLEAGSDFSGYMVPGVSSALRRRALKRLWSTGNYNVRDGLDDYDLDYRQQLKPMASELAGKLRRWVKKADESLDQNAEETSANETTAPATAENDTRPSEASDETIPVQHENDRKSSLDDQSDNAQTKA